MSQVTEVTETIQPDQDQMTPDGAEASTEAQPDAGEKRVPVSESIRYRRRAQNAEQQLEALQGEYEQISRQLEQTQRQLEQVERRQRIDQLLIESEAIDLEAARLLTEAAVEQMDQADVDEAVTQLRRRKPYLFRRTSPISGGTLSPRLRGVSVELDEAAADAAASGDRRDLLRYLRLRRNET